MTYMLRGLLDWALSSWEAPDSADLLSRLDRQVCHGDTNEMNIIVSWVLMNFIVNFLVRWELMLPSLSPHLCGPRIQCCRD